MYDARYDEEQIRSNHFDFVAHMRKHLNENALLLDLGCGTCRKTAKMAEYVRSAWGIDYNDEMIRKAADNLTPKKIYNVRLTKANNFNTPFPSHSFDICTACLTTWSAAEVYRILKPGGLFLIETLSADDKQEIKRLFPDDDIGKRGYLSNQNCDERLFRLKTELGTFFNILDLQTVSSRTTLHTEDLITLLEITPTIRGFNRDSDFKYISPAIQNGSVTFVERRIYIVAEAKQMLTSGHSSNQTESEQMNQ